MFRRLFWPVIFAVAFCSGCVVTESSLNVQRSVLRGAGDSGATSMLENQNEAEVAEIVKGVVGICNDVLAFLDSGNINLLTKGELKVKLLEVVPEDSRKFVDDILSLVVISNVDIDIIGFRNVKRIRAFLKGVIKGSEKYDVGDR